MEQGADTATNWQVWIENEENLPLEGAAVGGWSAERGNLQPWWFSRYWWTKPWNASSERGDAHVQVSATSAGMLEGQSRTERSSFNSFLG